MSAHPGGKWRKPGHAFVAPPPPDVLSWYNGFAWRWSWAETSVTLQREIAEGVCVRLTGDTPS